jgi:hypothetical protein
MKFFKRLGAATGVVALLAGGLVGVAAPAQAKETSKATNVKVVSGNTYRVDWRASGSVYELYSHLKYNDAQIGYSESDCAESGTKFLEGSNQYPAGSFWEATGKVTSGPNAVNGEFTAGTQDANCTIELKKVVTAADCTETETFDNGECRDKTEEEKCAEIDGAEWENDFCWKEVVDIQWPSLEVELDDSLDLPSNGVGGLESTDGQWYTDVKPVEGNPTPPSELHEKFFASSNDVTQRGVTEFWGIPVPADVVDGEPVQKNPPPPPCWSAEALNNCPVGGALRFAAPKYAMVGVPVTMYAYVSWRPDANSPAQPTNGTAVIRVDGEDYSGVEFVDGVAEWRFIPETAGMKEFTASGVVSSGISGANAYIDSVPARTYVLEYDPAAYATALKKKRVEIGDTYVITDPNQARSYVEDRYEWSVSEKSDGVCAVYETKKGAVKAKFTDSGKCTVIWMDKESEESGKYTFIAKK